VSTLSTSRWSLRLTYSRRPAYLLRVSAKQRSANSECNAPGYYGSYLQKLRLNLNRAQLSPIELLASFQFPSALKNEVLDEDRITAALAQALGLAYRKIYTLKLDAQFISKIHSVHSPFQLGRERSVNGERHRRRCCNG
jgi:hypothetical protein